MKKLFITALLSLLVVLTVAQPRVGSTAKEIIYEFGPPEWDTVTVIDGIPYTILAYSTSTNLVMHYMTSGVCVVSFLQFYHGYSLEIVETICSANRAKVRDGIYWDAIEALYYQVYVDSTGHVTVRVGEDYILGL